MAQTLEELAGKKPHNNWDPWSPGTIANYALDPFDLSGQRAASTAFQNQQTLDEQARQFSSAEAAKQRAWEERMSSTAIQRQVADAEAAGINKMALFGGSVGADTPSGSSASSSGGSASMANNKLAAAAGVVALFLRMILTKGK